MDPGQSPVALADGDAALEVGGPTEVDGGVRRMPDREKVVLEVGRALTVLLVADVGFKGLVIGLRLPTGGDWIGELPAAELDIIIGEIAGGIFAALLVVAVGTGVVEVVVDVMVVAVVVVVDPRVDVAVVVLVIELVVVVAPMVDVAVVVLAMELVVE